MNDRFTRDLSGGMTLAGLRNHNERLVLSAIQRHGELAAAELARLSGLSAQTVSVISRGVGTGKACAPRCARAGQGRQAAHTALPSIQMGLMLSACALGDGGRI